MAKSVSGLFKNVNTLAMFQLVTCSLALAMIDVLTVFDSVVLAIVAVTTSLYFAKRPEKAVTAPARPVPARRSVAVESRRSAWTPRTSFRAPAEDSGSDSWRTGSTSSVSMKRPSSQKSIEKKSRSPARPTTAQVRLNKELAKLESPWEVLETVMAFEGSPNGVNLATAIHRVAKSAKHRSIKVETVTAHPQFRQILELVMEPTILAQLGSQEISNIIWAFASLRYNDKSMVEGLIRLLKDQIGVVSCHEVSITLWALTTLRHCDSETLEVLVQRAVQLLDDLQGKEIVMIAWSMAMNHMCMPEVFVKFADAAVKKFPLINVQGVSVMVWCLAAVGVKHDALFEAAAARVFSLRKEDIQNLDISNIVFAFAEQGCVHTELFAFLSSCPAVTQCMPDILEALETGKLTAASAWRKGAVTLRV